MSYNKENLGRIRELFNTKHIRAEEDADRRRAELHKLLPALAGIDARLAATGPRLMAVSLRKSDETFAAVRADVEELNRARAALLAEAGYPADYTYPHYECNICNDSGYTDGHMCECMRRELIYAGYESSGIARLMQTQTFETFSLDYYRQNQKIYDNMKMIYRRMRDYALNFNTSDSPSLALFGGTGLGKTHLSTAVAKTVIERGYDVVYTGAIGMLADFEQARFGNASGAGSGNETDRYFDCDLLIIDDLGSEIGNQFTVSCIYNIINTRINRKIPTIISTNLSKSELEVKYWDRITSRILGEYLPLVFTGTDVRKQKLG